MAEPAAGNAESPLVSVIMPTRGRPDLVRASIAGVVAQSYPGAIELLVVHDQEPLNQELAALGTPARTVRVLANTRTPGLAGARNTGLSAASGEYIATCDDDDVWHPGKLQAQMERLHAEPGLLVVGSGIRLLLPGGKILDWPGRAEHISYDLLLSNRVKELHSSTLVMRREAFEKAGLYDEELPRGYAEDYDWVLRAARVGPLGVVPRPLADIRKDAQSFYQGKAESTAAALEHLLAKHPDFACSRRGHARILGQIAFARSLMGERGTALRYTLRALSRWPLSPQAYIALAQATTGLSYQRLMKVARLLRRGMA